MGKIVLVVFVIFCLPGLLQVAEGTKSPSQYTDEVVNFTADIIEHEAPFTIIDALAK